MRDKQTGQQIDRYVNITEIDLRKAMQQIADLLQDIAETAPHSGFSAAATIRDMSHLQQLSAWQLLSHKPSNSLCQIVRCYTILPSSKSVPPGATPNQTHLSFAIQIMLH